MSAGQVAGLVLGQRVDGIDFVANNAEMGGGEIMLLRMAATARELGIDVRVVGPDLAADVGDAATRLGLPFVAVPGRDRRAYGLRLAALSRSWGSRIVWCNGLVPALATVRCHAPRVVHLHQLPAGAGQWRALRVAARHAVAVVTPSASMSRQFPGSLLPLGPVGPLGPLVLENWTEDASPTSRSVLSSVPVSVGFLGRLSPSKGVDVLADAMSILEQRLPGHCTLSIAGDARFVPPRDAGSVRSHLGRCRPPARLLGWVDPDRLFAEIDIAVVPSVWDEPFGLVAAQAMARGVPLVVTDAGALPDIVGPGYPWIAPRGDAAALADVISRVLADAARARRQAGASRARWEQRFSPKSGQQRFADLLQSASGDVLAIAGLRRSVEAREPAGR